MNHDAKEEAIANEMAMEELEEQIKELKKYKKFYDHVANHKEVKEAQVNPGHVMCKICNKTFEEIVEK